MSELKAETFFLQHESGENYAVEFYPKSEADKVIAGLQDKLQKESALLKETREWLIESQKLHKRCADNAVKVICHSNYKRCLAMAKWCESENYTACWYHENSERCEWTEKWHKRWLELAEKFKPNNSTAQ